MSEVGPRYFGPPLEREALDFEGVTFRIFPLKANPYRLERFCDDYLNQGLRDVTGEPRDDIDDFRPALPYVLLEVINYGRMSPKASNLGWLSQNEVLFAVPLEWYRKEDGRWRFVDWATVAPFIFVDDDQSTAEGREIYGWPKVLSTIEAEADPWMEDPRSRRRLLTLKTQMFSELYAGRRLQPSRLLQVEQRLPETASQWMPDLAYLARPLLGPASLLMQGLGALADLSLDAVNRWREVGDPGAGVMGEALRRGLRFGPQELYGNTINLKQFRGSEPRTACFQALVNARFTFKKFHGGGPLGDIELLRGDPSGGFQIQIHRHPAYPIIESLGLEVVSEERGRGRPTSLLKPQFPWWFRADTRYEMGENVAWRIESRRWRTPEPDAPKARPAIGWHPKKEGGWITDPIRVEPAPGQSGPSRVGTAEAKPLYNTSLGPVISAAQEPFDFWDATVRAISLQADAERLNQFIESRLTLPPELGTITLEPPRELRFIVKDAGGEELSGVLLELEDGDKRLERKTRTDGTATFGEPELDRDVWLLRASMDGMTTFSHPRISVRGARGLPIDIEMMAHGVTESITATYERDAYESSVPVILQISSYGPMSAAANDIGRWAECEVGLAVPVWFTPEGATKATPVLFWAYVFSDSPIAVRTDREVTGMPTEQAEICGGVDRWLESTETGRRLLTVKVGAYPALHVGARRRQRLLLRIEGDPSGPPERAFREVEDEVSEYGNGLELDHLTVKQFRDAEQPRLACYQSVVAARTFVGKWHRPGSKARVDRDPTTYRVFVHELESHPLVAELGLCTGPTLRAEDGSRVAEVKPYSLDRSEDGEPGVHALSMLVDLRHHVSRTLCWRGIGSPRWTLDEAGVAYVQERAKAHLEEVDNFGAFIDALGKRVDGASGLSDH